MNKELANIFNGALCFSTEQWWESYSSFLFFGMEFICDESAYYQGFIEVLDGMQGNSDRIWVFHLPVVLFYFSGKPNLTYIETCQMLLFYGT